MSDFNIYDDLELLHAQQEQKQGEELQWKEKYHVALETIQKLQVEKKELNKKIKQLEINFASLLDTARTEIKRKDNQIHQLRREKDDICFRRNERPAKKYPIGEIVGEDKRNEGGHVNPFSIDLKTTVPKSCITSSKPVEEKNKASTSRQRNGECEEKNKRSSYRESRSESSRERGRDRDRSRHLSRETYRRKDERDLDHRRDRYDRTSSQARSSDSSRETTDKGQNRHSHRSGYTKDHTKSTNGYSSSSKYENHSKAKRDACIERSTYKPKESKTGRSDDGLKEKENTDNGKTSALQKEILNDVKELKKAKQSEIENETQAQIAAVKARTEESNNFLDALFDDMVLSGEKEQTNDLYNDLPLETEGNDKIEPKEIAPKTDENCNVEPIMQTPLKQSVTTLLDDLFGPSPANSAVNTVVSRRISLSSVGESSDAVSSDTVEFVPIVNKAKDRDEPKKSAPVVVVSDSLIDVSSADGSEVGKQMTNSDEVNMKNLPNPVSATKAFQFVELDSSFYSSDEGDDGKTDTVIDLRESQSDIDSPPFEKCQLLRSDIKSKEQTSGTKEIIIETPDVGHDEMTFVQDVLTTLPDDAKKCSKPSTPEKSNKDEIACNSSAKNGKRKGSPQENTRKHQHHSSKHAKSAYSSRSRNEKHRHRSERFRREDEKHYHHHHRHYHSSKESTKSMRTTHQNENRSPRSSRKYSKNTTNEENQKEFEVMLVWSEDTEDHTPALVKQTAAQEDTSSDLKLYHDQVIALHCDDISEEEGVEADPTEKSDEGSKVPRTLEDLVISLQCEDLSDEEEVQFVVETNNEVTRKSEEMVMQMSSDNIAVAPVEVVNYEAGERMDSSVQLVSIDQAIALNDEVVVLNSGETQPYAVCSVDAGEMALIVVEEPSADMNQPCQSMFPAESTKSTPDELYVNREGINCHDEQSYPACLQIESKNSPPKPSNSPPSVSSQEQPSSQDSTDVSSSIGRRKKLKTPRKNTNIATAVKRPSANLKALLPQRSTKSDDEYGLTATKQADASNLHPRRRQSVSDLGEAATYGSKELIPQEVIHFGEAATDLTQTVHKPCLIVEEELQKDMSPLWVEEESTEATIGLKSAVTNDEQSDTVSKTREEIDIPNIAHIAASNKRNTEDNDETLVTTSDMEIHKEKRIIPIPSVEEEPQALFVLKSSTESTAVFASESEKNKITTDTEVGQMELNSQKSFVTPESVTTSDSEIHGTQHVTEAGSAMVDLKTALPNAPIILECDALNNDLGQKCLASDVNDNQKSCQESTATSDNQKKCVGDFTPPVDQKQVAASGNRRKRSKNDVSSCDKDPVASKSTLTSADKEKFTDNQEGPPFKEAAKRGRKNKSLPDKVSSLTDAPKPIVAEDEKTSKVSLDSSGEQQAPTSVNNSQMERNILHASTRCVVKLPILQVFSCFDAKNPLTDDQQVATSDENRKLNSILLPAEKQQILTRGDVQIVEQQVRRSDSNTDPSSKLLQDAPSFAEKQTILPVFDVQISESPLTDEQQVATSAVNSKPKKNLLQHLTDSSNSVCEKSKSPPTDEQQVVTSDQNTLPNAIICQQSNNSDDKSSLSTDSLNCVGKKSEVPAADEQQVPTSDHKTLPNANTCQQSTNSDGKPSTLTDSSNSVCEKSKSPPTNEQQVATSDDKTLRNVNIFLQSNNSDGKPSLSTDSLNCVGKKSEVPATDEQQVPTSDQNIQINSSAPTNSDGRPFILPYSESQTDEQQVTTSETFLRDRIDSDEMKISSVQLQLDKMKASLTEVDAASKNASDAVTTSDGKTTSNASCTQNPSDLDSSYENNKKNLPNDQSNSSLESVLVQPVATSPHNRKYKKRILNTFNNSKTEAGESDKLALPQPIGSETETLVTCNNKRKRTKVNFQESSDSACDDTIEGLQTSDVQSASTSGHKTKQRKRNVPKISDSDTNNQQLADADTKHVHREPTAQLPAPTSETSPKSGTKQKIGRRNTVSEKKSLLIDTNKLKKTTLEHTTVYDAAQVVLSDTQQIDQNACCVKRKYKKRSAQAVAPASKLESPATPCSKDTTNIQNNILLKSSHKESQQLISNNQQDIANNLNVPSSNESIIYIKRKMKPSNHPKKRRIYSTSSSDTINVTSDSVLAPSNVSDVQPSPTTTGKRKRSLSREKSTPAVTPTHHKIFHEDVYPDDQPPPVYNANGDDIQYQEIDNRMRSIFQSPTYPHINGGPSFDGANTTVTCVELQVDISKGDITIDETLHPGESSLCDTSSLSRKISVGSNDYVIETVGAHTANVFVTRKKCKKRTKAVKMPVPTA